MYFYLPDLNQRQIQKPLSDHLLSCRIKDGEKIFATDLNGNLAEFLVSEVDLKKGNYRFGLLQKQQFEPPKTPRILIQGQPERLYIEKICEILPLAGIDRLILFASDYTQKQNLNLARLDKILIRSCEQSHQVYKPEIEIVERKAFPDLIAKLRPVVLDIFPKNENKQIQSNSQRISDNTISALVGPEGGWSVKELEVFRHLGLEFQSLGDTIYPAWIAGYTWFSRQK
jgi:RsmE family RNA methyltransferase